MALHFKNQRRNNSTVKYDPLSYSYASVDFNPTLCYISIFLYIYEPKAYINFYS